MAQVVFNVNEEIRIKAYNLFNRTKGEVVEDIKTITEWMKTQPHLPEIMSENKIENFLLLNKFSIEKTKQKIDAYYTIRTHDSDFFNLTDPKSQGFKDCYKKCYFCVQPNLYEELYRVHFFKTKAPSTYMPLQTEAVCLSSVEMRLKHDVMVGDVFVIDGGNFTLNDVLNFSPSVAVKTFGMYSKILAMRLKAVYIINSTSIFAKSIKVLKLVIKPKLFERVHVCADASILKEVFEDNFLPSDYGGKGPSLDQLSELSEALVAEYRQDYDKLAQLKVDEALRPQKLSNDELFGYYGNFKQLNVD